MVSKYHVRSYKRDRYTVVVGQLARDVQFANDINNILDVLINGDTGSRGMTIDGLYKVGGNFLAGFTRPLRRSK